MSREQHIDAILAGQMQFKRLFRCRFGAELERLHVSPAQIEALQVISDNQPLSHKQLAELLQLTPGAVSQLLDGLERLECITRVSSPTDRRSSLVSVSKHGMHILKKYLQHRDKAVSTMLASLDEADLKIYAELQSKLIAALNAANEKETK